MTEKSSDLTVLGQKMILNESTQNTQNHEKVNNVFENKRCIIYLPKVSMRQMCKDYNIPYRQTLIHYDLTLPQSEDIDSDSSDESEKSTSMYQDYLIYQTHRETPKKSSKYKKKKKCDKLFNNLVTNKRKNEQKGKDLTPNKRIKTNNKLNNSVTNDHIFNTSNGFTPKTKKKTKQSTNKRHICSPTEDVLNTSIDSMDETPYKSCKNNSKKKTNQWKGSSLLKKGDKKEIEFLSEHFQSCELFPESCDCEHNCQLDELSMAFQFIMDLSPNDLPKDIKIAVIGRSADTTSDEEKSDQNFDEILPPIDEIYEQSIEDDSYLNEYVDDFVKSTTKSTHSSNLILHPSTTPSVQSVSSQMNAINAQMNGVSMVAKAIF